MEERTPMPRSSASAPHRHLPLSGTYNVRDIGGYRTHDGHTTRWRTIFRADSLHRLTAEAQTTLLAHGLRTIVDLRRSEEVQAAPNVFANATTVTYRQLSLMIDTPPDPQNPRSLVEVYRHILDERQEQVYAVLSTLARPEHLPVLVHCTAGKDRTGIIMALALGLAGVPEDTIVEDYALSATYLRGTFLNEMRQRALARGYTWEQYEPMVASPPEHMRTILAYLGERYGGFEAYARSIGLRPAQLHELRSALVL